MPKEDTKTNKIPEDIAMEYPDEWAEIIEKLSQKNKKDIQTVSRDIDISLKNNKDSKKGEERFL